MIPHDTHDLTSGVDSNGKGIADKSRGVDGGEDAAIKLAGDLAA
jgi:hypothetical protein